MTEKSSEDRDVNIRAIIGYGAALAAALAAVLLVLWLFTRSLLEPEGGEHAAAPMSTELSRVPPDPRLQPDPRGQLQALRAFEKKRLGSYGWVDKGAGIVHIPIERAMQIVAERGLPVRAEGGPEPGAGIATPTDSSLGVPGGGANQ